MPHSNDSTGLKTATPRSYAGTSLFFLLPFIFNTERGAETAMQIACHTSLRTACRCKGRDVTGHICLYRCPCSSPTTHPSFQPWSHSPKSQNAAANRLIHALARCGPIILLAPLESGTTIPSTCLDCRELFSIPQESAEENALE